ncbi:MAG: hypothetical protein JXP34_26580 [Planctomycetes bacterium]|nr:hypothetical protein [Planctomycetota bacterium]
MGMTQGLVALAALGGLAGAAETAPGGGRTAGERTAERRPTAEDILQPGPNILALLDLGLMREPEESATATLGGEVAFGAPLADPIGLGFQLGGGFRLREVRPDVSASAGVFRRDLALGQAPPIAGALLLDYRYTQHERSLFALRPEGFVAITPENAIGASGTFPLNDEVIRRRGTRRKLQRFVPRGEIFWACRWAPELGTEIGVGYLFGDTSAPVLRGSLFWSIDDQLGLVPAAEVSLHGEYAVGIAAAIDFGGAERSLGHRLPGCSPYTPFPMWSFGRITLETERRR